MSGIGGRQKECALFNHLRLTRSLFFLASPLRRIVPILACLSLSLSNGNESLKATTSHRIKTREEEESNVSENMSGSRRTLVRLMMRRGGTCNIESERDFCSLFGLHFAFFSFRIIKHARSPMSIELCEMQTYAINHTFHFSREERTNSP